MSGPGATLLVLPHAGGASHAYQPLARLIRGAAEVRCLDLPGHGRRAKEPPLSSMEDLAGLLAAELLPMPGPWAVLGHSMGAQLAYALACQARRMGLPQPAHLFLSGSPPPGPGPRRPHIAHLPAREFLAAVAGYGLMPAEAAGDDLFRSYFEPLLRADFTAVEGFDPAGKPLEVPATVLYGRDDLSGPEAAAWGALFSMAPACLGLPGGHFYLLQRPGAVAELVSAVLAAIPGRRLAGLGA